MTVQTTFSCNASKVWGYCLHNSHSYLCLISHPICMIGVFTTLAVIWGKGGKVLSRVQNEILRWLADWRQLAFMQNYTVS